MKPLVSIIIINWNGGEILKDCLRSLSQLTYPKWELIIVDNASSDESEEYYKTYPKLSKKTKLIKNKTNLGFAPANNQGYKFAKGKYILLLNNDTTVSRDLLEVLVNKMQSDTTVGVLQPKIFIMDKKGYLDNAGSFMTRIGFLTHWGFLKKDGKEFDSETEIFSAKGACLFARREVIEKVGLFDPDFHSYFEESDFCFRVWLGGWRILYYPKTFIYHKVGFTITRIGALNLNYHYYKNRICSLIKNLNTINLFVIVPVHIFLSLGIATVFLVRGGGKNALLIIRAIWWNVMNLPKTLKKREKVQKLRTVGDNEIFKRVGKKVNFAKFFNDFKRVEKDLSTT